MGTRSELLAGSDGRELMARYKKFFSTLIIKNSQEADAKETPRSYGEYATYLKCQADVAQFKDFEYSTTSMLYFGISSTIVNEYEGNPEGLQALTSENHIIKAFLDKLSADYINSYRDGNEFYRVISGKPANESEVVMIVDRDAEIMATTTTVNLDKKYPGQPDVLLLKDVTSESNPKTNTWLYTEGNIGNILEVIPRVALHDVKFNSNPNTFSTLYYSENLIDQVRAQYPHEYISFIDKQIDITSVREAGNFDVVWYDSSVLQSEELDYFHKVYAEVKGYIMRNKYLPGLEGMYSEYAQFELLVILFGVFQRMITTNIDKYSVRIFTDAEVYDILDSFNLSTLKSVDGTLIRKILDNIDKLLSLRGSEDVLEVIFDIVAADRDISVRRYDLVKTFNTDENGKIDMDRNNPYDKSVGLAFVDRVIYAVGSLASQQSNSRLIPYTSFVRGDPTWGANGKYETESGREGAIEEVRLALLKQPFHTIDTKYIGVTSTIFLEDAYNNFTDKLSLLFQYAGSSLNGILGRWNFLGMQVKPIDLYAIAYLGFSVHMNIKHGNFPDYDEITPDVYTFSDMLRLVSGVSIEDIQALEYQHYDDGLTYTVGDVLKHENLENYIMQLDTTSVDSLAESYDRESHRYKKLKIRHTTCTEELEKMAWGRIVEFYTTKVSIESAFLGYTSFNEYFKSSDNTDLHQMVKDEILSAPDPIRVGLFSRLAIKVFKEAVSGHIAEPIDSQNFNLAVKLGNDLSLLIDAFVSMNVELRSVDVNVTLNDESNNSLQMWGDSYWTAETVTEQLYRTDQNIGMMGFLYFENKFDLTYGVSGVMDITITGDTFETRYELSSTGVGTVRELYRTDNNFGLETHQLVEGMFSLGCKIKIYNHEDEMIYHDEFKEGEL